ncbi:NAD(P)-binding protein, partial [Pseudomonas aeruginosa]
LLQDILTEKYKHTNAQQSFISWLKTLDSSR